MTPAESAERARLVAKVEEAEEVLRVMWRDSEFEPGDRDAWDEADEKHSDALDALAAFDAAHKGEG